MCKLNIVDYLNEAESLLKNTENAHAYVLVHFAIEELGKSLLLQDRRKEANHERRRNVVFKDGEEWRNHRVKTERAWKALPAQVRVVHEGFYDGHFYDTGFYDTDLHADHGLRLGVAYVNWKEGWRLERNIDSDKLRPLIGAIRNVADGLKDQVDPSN